MLRIILFCSILISYRSTAIAQSEKEIDYINKDNGIKNESAVTAETDGPSLRPRKELGYENRMAAGSGLVWGACSGPSGFVVDTGNTENYMASLRITDLLWPGRQGADRGDRNGLIMIGLKKPYYRISGTSIIRGSLDFRLGGSFFGIENRGLIAVGYYLKTEDTLRELSSSVSVERLSFSIYIPF